LSIQILMTIALMAAGLGTALFAFGGPDVFMRPFGHASGGGVPPSSTSPNEVYTDPAGFAHRRSMELQSAVPEKSRGRVTMSAGVVENPDGTRQVLIGTSEDHGFLRKPVHQVIAAYEQIAPGFEHAEQDIVRWAQNHGQRVIAVGAGRPHCDECVKAIEQAGGITASPRRNP
jgi:hypothetical protein